MLNQTARTQAWLADLATIITEIDAGALPTPRPALKRTRNRKPLWEE